MNTPAKIKKLNLPVMSETEALMTAVERMARDPSVDPAKVQAFLEIRRQMLADNAERSYAAAFAELQSTLPVLPAKGVIPVKGARKRPDGSYAPTDIRSRFVRWEDAIETLRPLLHANGFSLSHRINVVPPAMQVGPDGMTGVAMPGTGGVEVTAVLLHRDGHSNQTSFLLPIDVNDFRNRVQDHASTVSYGKRYTAFALLGIVGRDEVDADGETPPKEPISEVQFRELLELCAQVADVGGTGLVNFLNKQKGINVGKLMDVPAEHYEWCVGQLENAKKKRGVK